MSENKFNQLKSVISELREKCPWDRKQTFQSLRSLTIEEVYELSEAIINQDPKNIEEESGDLLLHILFYAKLGEEKKAFFNKYHYRKTYFQTQGKTSPYLWKLKG